ncbi:thiamine diphosphokinase [Halanaerobium congolense]|jgi:thiamine pyrophosphokinase|uniref:Thiamine diphosphokinase n=1 Tax=Halanaerobium congolense TaxID=54121 RepID=A0A1G6HRM5_9FIRM|nr:thiamine diphosphokinase [Halanaerobium congolense]KXS50098.1 MAG: Thiamin pyrophosphokinase [Halanaerobium sp. T82-1]OEG63077.1 MAG: thiamine diphosphokinase [Halanaerobium sp. MDAL1]PUU90510.1 MAG: thiamine pyrophosphokinase [Halanaerobium sp.]PXV69940.1 thiamine diphosphokinase [Halanaerobium congolense]TDS33054.1 thiamine diphosphokinase [Halanaerobium congolense]
MSDKTAALILNGVLDLDKDEFAEKIKNYQIDKIIAVDGGANNIRELEVLPDLILGDLDSITKQNKDYYSRKNIDLLKYPVEKDQTDSEIAVDYCLEYGINKIYLFAALGGRIDQQLANLNLLEYIDEINLEAKIISQKIEIALIKNNHQFEHKKGYRLSLIPQSKKVEGVTIKGCKYNLKNQDIKRSKSRGISNLIEEEKAEVIIENGVLFYVLENLD